jgi:hypothetical protein
VTYGLSPVLPFFAVSSKLLESIQEMEQELLRL